MILESRPKRPHQEEEEGTWIISYADMITLLLAFFVLFFTIDPEVKTDEEIKSSLFVALNDKRAPASQMEASSLPGNTGSENLKPVFDQKLSEAFKLKAYQMGRRIVVDFPKTSFFELGHIDVANSGLKQLKKFVKIYMPYAGQYTLGIRAFTDSRKVKKIAGLRYQDNLELSALRSVAAMRVLQKLGIPLERMKLGGYGELKVTEENLKNIKLKTDAMSLARKVVLVIEPNEGVPR